MQEDSKYDIIQPLLDDIHKELKNNNISIGGLDIVSLNGIHSEEIIEKINSVCGYNLPSQFSVNKESDNSYILMHMLSLSVGVNSRSDMIGSSYDRFIEMVLDKHKIKKYMKIAQSMSDGSKCQKARHGCIIVSDFDTVVGAGYNFHPRNTNKDEVCKRKNIPSGTHTHIGYCCHAETNAIINSVPRERQNGTLYVTSAPCNMCALNIMQSGVKYLVYIEKPATYYRGARLFHELGSKVIPICIPEKYLENYNE